MRGLCCDTNRRRKRKLNESCDYNPVKKKNYTELNIHVIKSDLNVHVPKKFQKKGKSAFDLGK